MATRVHISAATSPPRSPPPVRREAAPTSDLVRTLSAVRPAIAAAASSTSSRAARGFQRVASGFASNGTTPTSRRLLSRRGVFRRVRDDLFFLLSSSARMTAANAGLRARHRLALTRVTYHIPSLTPSNRRARGPPCFRGWAITQLWLFWLAPILGAARGAPLPLFPRGCEPRTGGGVDKTARAA